jgi:hypothetical protein
MQFELLADNTGKLLTFRLFIISFASFEEHQEH